MVSIMITSHIRDLATRYWELMHSPLDRRLECEVMAGRYQVVDPSCASIVTVRYLRNRLCAALGLDRCVAHYWLDDLSQYRDVCHFMCTIQNYLEEEEKRGMNKFPELKPMMLVECKDDRDIYTYYLIAGKHGEAYTAYRLNISSTGDVDLSGFYTVEDFPEQAVAVYATDWEDPALSPGSIFMIAENNSLECGRRVIWQREKKPLEVTMEEVCAKFGQEVKIVKEK